MALSELFYNFQNDPDRNKKLLFFGAWAVILTLLGAGIWAINQPKNPDISKSDSTIDPSLTDQTLLQAFATKFPESNNLKAISTKPAKNDRTTTLNNAGNPIFVSSQNEFMVGDQVIQKDFPISSPLSIYPIKLGFIVNDYSQSVFLLKDESSYKLFPTSHEATQIVPLNTGVDDFGFTSQEEYFFMVPSETGYKLKKSKSIQLDNAQDVATITSDMAKSGFYQIFRSRNSLLIGLYQNPGQQGKAEYWTFKNGNISKILDISDNWSTLVQENYLIITHQSLYSNLVSSYTNDIYDLTPDTPKLVDFAPSFSIRQLGLYGNMLARRCTVTQNSEVYCLIKEKPVKTENASEPDVVVKLNFTKKSAEIVGSNKSVPASSSLVSDLARKRLLLINQKDYLIYEFPLS